MKRAKFILTVKTTVAVVMTVYSSTWWAKSMDWWLLKILSAFVVLKVCIIFRIIWPCSNTNTYNIWDWQEMSILIGTWCGVQILLVVSLSWAIKARRESNARTVKKKLVWNAMNLGIQVDHVKALQRNNLDGFSVRMMWEDVQNVLLKLSGKREKVAQIWFASDVKHSSAGAACFLSNNMTSGTISVPSYRCRYAIKF